MNGLALVCAALLLSSRQPTQPPAQQQPARQQPRRIDTVRVRVTDTLRVVDTVRIPETKWVEKGGLGFGDWFGIILTAGLVYFAWDTLRNERKRDEKRDRERQREGTERTEAADALLSDHQSHGSAKPKPSDPSSG